MSLREKFEQCLKEIQELENSFRQSRGKELLPLSFFSSSIDSIRRLETGIYEIEETQLQVMQEHLRKSKSESHKTPEIKNAGESIVMKTPEEKTKPAVNILADTIGRKTGEDIRKSLSVNDRFMFQRDLFQGNTDEMNRAFAQLNTFRTLDEAMKFLNGNYAIPWDSDSGTILKELLSNWFA